MLSAFEFCYYFENFEDDISEKETSESRQDLELIKYFVYDHYTERHDRYSHYYGLTFDELYKDVDALLNRYAFKGETIRKTFCEGFNDWDGFEKEVDELFNVFLQKNNFHVKRKNVEDEDSD